VETVKRISNRFALTLQSFIALLMARTLTPIPLPAEQKRKAFKGQSTLEWVLIGGVMVVIIIALLVTVLRPALEGVIQNIVDLITQNTSGSGSGS
jgi:hypothetical protein